MQRDNHRRAWTLSVVVFVLELPLIAIDIVRLQAGILAEHVGYRSLFFLHLVLQAVLTMLIALLVAHRRRHGEEVTAASNAMVLLGAISVLVISGAITLADQLIHGQATVYLLGAVGMAIAVYMPVRLSIVVFGTSAALVLGGLRFVQPDPDILTGHLINISLVTAIAIAANSTLYRQAVRTVRHLRLIDEQRRRLDRLASEDELTGVANRRYGDRRFREELARYRRYNRPFSLCFGDLDHFKAVNDGFSHGVGDQALMVVARILESELREADLVVRYGGEEFVVLLPETTMRDAGAVCDKLREAVAAYDWNRIACGLVVTMSFGVADCTEACDLDGVLRAADRRLYIAKELGRNRVETRDRGCV